MKPKLLSIIFLFVFLLSIPTIILYLELKKFQIKKEVKNKIIVGLNKNDLVFFKFSKSEAKIELQWEHSREFEYKGEMYDVVEAKESSDSVYYWCWWDNEETILNKQLSKLFSAVWNNSPLKNDVSKRLADFFKTFYIKENAKKFVIQYFSSNLNYSFKFNFYKSLKLAPPELPPWF